MSKSRGNVLNPGEDISEYGADTMRRFELFLGPLEVVGPWSESQILGVHRFFHRVWMLCLGDSDACRPESFTDAEPAGELRRALHRTIAAVTEELEGLRFNTAISSMMDLVNALQETSRKEKLPALLSRP